MHSSGPYRLRSCSDVRHQQLLDASLQAIARARRLLRETDAVVARGPEAPPSPTLADHPRPPFVAQDARD